MPLTRASAVVVRASAASATKSLRFVFILASRTHASILRLQTPRRITKSTLESRNERADAGVSAIQSRMRHRLTFGKQSDRVEQSGLLAPHAKTHARLVPE